MKFNRWTLALAACGVISTQSVIWADEQPKCTVEWGGIKMEPIEDERRCAFCGSIALSFSELCSSCKDEWDAA